MVPPPTISLVVALRTKISQDASGGNTRGGRTREAAHWSSLHPEGLWCWRWRRGWWSVGSGSEWGPNRVRFRRRWGREWGPKWNRIVTTSPEWPRSACERATERRGRLRPHSGAIRVRGPNEARIRESVCVSFAIGTQLRAHSVYFDYEPVLRCRPDCPPNLSRIDRIQHESATGRDHRGTFSLRQPAREHFDHSLSREVPACSRARSSTLGLPSASSLSIRRAGATTLPQHFPRLRPSR